MTGGPGGKAAAFEPPRLLFLTSAAFNNVTGGGITFSHLFAGWPKERIATAHSDPVPVTTDVCERYYRLGPDEIRGWGPLRYVSRGGVAVDATGPSGGAKPRMMRRTLAPVKRALFGGELPDCGRISPRLERWVADFRPELLYSILGSNGMMELALALAARFDLPLAVHMMDDWPSALHRRGLLSFAPRVRMDRLLREVFARAALRIAICDPMAQAYGRRYAAPFIAFHNAVDLARWAAPPPRNEAPRSGLKVLYVGSILPFAQLESLVDCCRAVGRLATEGMNIELEIYSPAFLAEKYRRRLEVAANVHLRDAISDDTEFFETLRRADLLVLPVNFDPHSVSYIRYSMPTKVPAYLASGTPVLVYGPAEVAQVRYAREAGWGHVVSEQGVEAVQAAIRRLVSDNDLRAELSRTARAVAAARHDLRRVRGEFQGALAGAARSRS